MVGKGLFSSMWGAALQEKIAAKKEKQTARKEKAEDRRSLTKTHRKQKKAAIKDIRKSDDSKEDKKKKIGAARAFHKVKKGKVGGFAAYGEYSQKVSEKAKKKADRKAKVADRKAARKA